PSVYSHSAGSDSSARSVFSVARARTGIVPAAAKVTCGRLSRCPAALGTPAWSSRRHNARTAASASSSKKNSSTWATRAVCRTEAVSVQAARKRREHSLNHFGQEGFHRAAIELRRVVVHHVTGSGGHDVLSVRQPAAHFGLLAGWHQAVLGLD